MYPENNQPPSTNPADYLNQIAPQPTRKANLFDNKLIVLGGIAAVLLVIMIIVGGILSGGQKPIEQLAARLQTTSDIVDSSSGKIKSSQLRATNSSLHSQLINIIRDIEPILSKSNLNIKKLSSQVLSNESGDATLERLEDARLNAVYDRTYAREMAYQLDTLLTLMRQIDSKSSDETTKTFLDESYNNIEPLQQEFADFNASNL
jgi:hypothetical protein